MNANKLAQAMNGLDDKYLEEALGYEKPARRPWKRWGAAAACLALMLAAGGLLAGLFAAPTVTAYAYGTGEELTAAGAVLSAGTITDDGEMRGHPLMFYLSGEDIAAVRFSCKNQQLNFTDWTGQREEYGLAQNFTVPYGEDESQYYYLTVDWVPNALIRALTDDPETTIAALPRDLREDVIVLELTFADGRRATKAIRVSLGEDGAFTASFGDYKAGEEDDFLRRPDARAIPREVLYAQGSSAGERAPAPSEEVPRPTPAQSAAESDLAGAKAAARDYYAGTVFEVLSLEVKRSGDKEVVFSVHAAKGGVPQDPDRTITLAKNDGAWTVTNEGY